MVVLNRRLFTIQLDVDPTLFKIGKTTHPAHYVWNSSKNECLRSTKSEHVPMNQPLSAGFPCFGIFGWPQVCFSFFFYLIFMVNLELLASSPRGVGFQLINSQARAEALLDPWENKLTPMDEASGVPLSDRKVFKHL
jgi:hypothetical protein